MSQMLRIGAVMRPQWWEPFETSMMKLHADSIWLGHEWQSVSKVSFLAVDALVIELTREVVGTGKLTDSPPVGLLAGLPTCDESATLAEELGISEVLWDEDLAREWLGSLGASQGNDPPRLLAVWGSGGAPGATTLAIGLATELSKSVPVLLVDADFVAPSLAQLLGLPLDASGLLRALRVARNDNPRWELIDGCASVGGTQPSLRVLTGVSPGALERLEASAMPTLIEACLDSGVTVIADLKCLLASSRSVPERLAIEAILSRASRLFWVCMSSDLGVSRLVREWALLREVTANIDQSILYRVSRGPSVISYSAFSSALWEYTGCSDVRELPGGREPARSSGFVELLRLSGALSTTSHLVNRLVTSAFWRFVSVFPGPQRRKPLP